MIVYPLQKTILQKNIASTSVLPAHIINQQAFYPYSATPKQCTYSSSDQTHKLNHAYLKNLHSQKVHIKKLSIGGQVKKQLYKKSYELKCFKFEQGVNAMNSEDERIKYLSNIGKNKKNKAEHERPKATHNNSTNQIKQRYSVAGIVYNQQQYEHAKKSANRVHKNEIEQQRKRRNKICKSVHHNKTQSDPYSNLRIIQNQKQQNLVTKWLSINLSSTDLKKQMQTVLDVGKIGPRQYIQAQVVRDILATRIKNQVCYQLKLENNLNKIQAIMAFISASLKENLAENAKKSSLKKMNFVSLNEGNKDEACYGNIKSLISVKHRKVVKNERFSQSKIQDLKSQNSFQNCLNNSSTKNTKKKNSNVIMNIVGQDRKQKISVSIPKQQIRSVQSTKNQTCHEQKQSHKQLQHGNTINTQKQQMAVVLKQRNEIKNMFISSKIGPKKERSSHKSHKSVIVDSFYGSQMPIIYDIEKERKKQRRQKLFQQFGVQLVNIDGVKNVKAESRKVSSQKSSKFSIGYSTQIDQYKIDNKQNESPKKHHSNYLRKRQGLYSIVMNKMENKISQKTSTKNQLIKEDILEQQSIDNSIEKVVTSEDEEQVTSLKKSKQNKDISRSRYQQISISKLPNEDQSLADSNIKQKQNILLYSSMLKKSVAKIGKKVKRLSRAESSRSSVKSIQIQVMQSRKSRISKSIIRQSRLQNRKTSLFMMGRKSSRSQIEYMRKQQNRKGSNILMGQTEYKKIRRSSKRMKSVGILRALQNSQEQQMILKQKDVRLGFNKDKMSGKQKQKGETQNEETIQKRRQLRQRINNLQQSFRQLLPTKMDIEGSSIFCRFVPRRRGQIELMNELESIYQLKQDCELKTTYSSKEYNQDYLRMFKKDSFEVDLMRKLLSDGGMLKQTSMGLIKQPIFDSWH